MNGRLPLCATHHRALHTVGDEEKWWKIRAIDPIALAKRGQTPSQPARESGSFPAAAENEISHRRELSIG